MSFTEAIRTVLSKYATLSGRAARPEYWWWVLFILLLNIVTSLADGSGHILSFIIAMALLVPGFCVSVRRLHDTGRSGWWLLVFPIPLIGVLLLLYWMTRPGTEGGNGFGMPPGTTSPDAQL